MRPGGGKDKGSSFERDTCQKLSLWLSGGTRDDLLARNVLSGGQFTQARTRGLERGSPGDLTAIDPLGIPLMQMFLIECKHKRDLDLTGFIFDRRGSSFLAVTIALCRLQAKASNKQWLLVAKQNQREVLVFMEGGIIARAMRCMDASTRPPVLMSHRFHEYHRREVGVMYFDAFLEHVNSASFLATFT